LLDGSFSRSFCAVVTDVTVTANLFSASQNFTAQPDHSFLSTISQTTALERLLLLRRESIGSYRNLYIHDFFPAPIATTAAERLAVDRHHHRQALWHSNLRKASHGFADLQTIQ
jgi:hypothetical protein